MLLSAISLSFAVPLSKERGQGASVGIFLPEKDSWQGNQSSTYVDSIPAFISTS